MARCPAAFWLSVSPFWLALQGCASDPDAAEPELRPTFVEWRDLKADTRVAVANRSHAGLAEKRERGLLPPHVKLISDEDMGHLVGFLEENGFFEEARSIDPAAAPQATRALILYESGPTRIVLLHVRGAGSTDEGREGVGRFVRVKNELLRVYNESLDLRVVQNRRGEAIFQNPPPRKP